MRPPPIEDGDVVPPPAPVSKSEFTDEDKPPPPPRRRVQEAAPIVRPPATTAPLRPSGSPKAFAITAPRPEYPYEARRERLTGSGVATLTIDMASGAVTSVTMSRSTGSAVLDNATISGFRHWRFRPGTVSRVQTPITYTLTGASY
jgi:TonB family protein